MTTNLKECASHIRVFTMAVSLATAAVVSASAQERVVPDTYLAVTTNMTPADVEIKADVLSWSTEEEREFVIAALRSEDPSAALRDLPSKGAVWRANSAVGATIKYAHRAQMENGSERITLVTDRTVGYTSFSPWVADNPATDASLDYSVIELTIGGANEGQGTLSLSAEVSFDEVSNLVSLDPRDGAPLLTRVRMAPKPYWAREDQG